MILSALASYYQRHQDLPAFGWQRKPISFVVVLSEEGQFVQLEDVRNKLGKGQLFLVPKAVQRTSFPLANWGWDNASYLFQLSEGVLPWIEEKLQLLEDLSVQMDDAGQASRIAQVGGQVILLPPSLLPGGKLIKDLPPELIPSFRLWNTSGVESLAERSSENISERGSCAAEEEVTYGSHAIERNRNRKNYQAFKARVESLYRAYPHHPSIQALYQFYQQDWWHQLWLLEKDPLWGVFKSHLQSNLSFRVRGHAHLVAEELREVDLPLSTSPQQGLCLVSGCHLPLSHSHTPVPILGSQRTARLVSFQHKVGYESYGRLRMDNAPISEQMEFQYTTALNALLQKESVHQFSLANRTYVGWLSASFPLEEELLRDVLCCFSPYIIAKKKVHSPLPFSICLPAEVLRQKYHEWIRVVTTWQQKPTHTALYLHVLGLFPNAARLAVCWSGTYQVVDFLENLRAYLQVAAWKDSRLPPKPYYALSAVLQAVSMDNQLQNLPPKWVDECFHSLLEFHTFPKSVFRACLHEMMRSGSLLYAQLSVLKSYLLVMAHEPLLPCLDEQNSHPFYLLGRYLALLEMAMQEQFLGLRFRYRFLTSLLRCPFPTFKELLRRFPLSSFNDTPYYKVLGSIQINLIQRMVPQQPTEVQQGLLLVGYAQQLQVRPSLHQELKSLYKIKEYERIEQTH